MSRFSRLIKGVNWKYSIGEVLLIVIGILIAFSLSNWNEKLKREKDEAAMLEEIQTSLSNDLKSIEASIGIYELGTRSIELTLDHIKTKKPYNDSLDSYFGKTVHASFFLEDRGAYETLTSRGRELITSDSLRIALATLYAHNYVYLKKVEQIDFDHLVNNVAPHYSKVFKDFHFAESATPVDYDALLQDYYFLGLLEWLRTDRELLLSHYKRTREKIKEVIGMIDRELGKD